MYLCGSKRNGPLNRLRLCEEFLYGDLGPLAHVLASAEAGRARRPRTVRVHS